MEPSDQLVTLSREQVSELARRLSRMRHDINNHLALVIAASELLGRRSDPNGKTLETLLEQPQRIIDEMQSFSEYFEGTLKIERE